MRNKNRRKIKNKQELDPNSGASTPKPKRVRKVMTPRKKIEKPFNAGTMTVNAFWSFIRSALRKRTIVWKPIQLCKQASRRPYKGSNKRRKFEYQCSKCLEFFPGEEISVHHKIPAGRLLDFNDLPSFVKNLFCEIGDLECVCEKCHEKIHKKDGSNNRENTSS